MNKTMEAALAQSRRDLEEHRKRERESGRRAGSELDAVSGYIPPEETALRDAAGAALDALKQLDMQPMNCRAYIRKLKEAITAYDTAKGYNDKLSDGGPTTPDSR
jgi:hypothetical protein